MSETAAGGSAGGSGATPLSTSSAAGSGSSGSRPSRVGSDRAERGRTTVADGVVEKIAGVQARDVDGIHAMGGGLARSFGAVKDRVPGSNKPVSRGVKAEVGEVQTAIDLDLVVEYGYRIADLARKVRENVIEGVERMTGLEVVEVNITVDDVHLPDEDDEDEDQDGPRLQ